MSTKAQEIATKANVCEHTNEWVEAPLGDFLRRVVGGGTPSRAVDEYWRGEIPWASVKDLKEDTQFLIDTEEHISPAGLAKSAANLIEAGISVVSTRMAVGRAVRFRRPTAINQDLKALYPNDKLEPAFLILLLGHIRPQLESLSIGSTVKGIGLDQLLGVRVKVPAPRQQSDIVQVIENVDSAVQQTTALIAKLTLIKQGLMQDVLARGIDEKGIIRSEKTHKFKNSPIGRIPEQWGAQRLETLATAIDPQPSHRAPDEDRDGYPYLGVGDFKEDGSADFASCRKVPLEAVRSQKRRFDIERRDILFGKIGTIGAPRFLPSNQYYALNANTILIKPKEDNSFVFWLLNSFYLDNAVNQQVHTTSQPAFGIKKVRAMLIPVPHREDERNQISQRLDLVQTVITKELVFKRKLERLKKGLMGDLLTGRVRVSHLLKQ